LFCKLTGKGREVGMRTRARVKRGVFTAAADAAARNASALSCCKQLRSKLSLKERHVAAAFASDAPAARDADTDDDDDDDDDDDLRSSTPRHTTC
jgi:hypothetical protein